MVHLCDFHTSVTRLSSLCKILQHFVLPALDYDLCMAICILGCLQRLIYTQAA